MPDATVGSFTTTDQCISYKLISELVVASSAPSGVMDSKMYMVDFILPNNIAVKHINVLGAYPSSTDVLIGMDIIGLGDFAVTNYLNQTSFTFRVPSAERMDFTKA